MDIIITVLFLLFFPTLFAIICFKMAESRGRNTALAGFLGFFLGLIAVIGYAIAGKTRERQIEDMAEAQRRANGIRN